MHAVHVWGGFDWPYSCWFSRLQRSPCKLWSKEWEADLKEKSSMYVCISFMLPLFTFPAIVWLMLCSEINFLRLNKFILIFLIWEHEDIGHLGLKILTKEGRRSKEWQWIGEAEKPYKTNNGPELGGWSRRWPWMSKVLGRGYLSLSEVEFPKIQHFWRNKSNQKMVSMGKRWAMNFTWIIGCGIIVHLHWMICLRKSVWTFSLPTQSVCCIYVLQNSEP